MFQNFTTSLLTYFLHVYIFLHVQYCRCMQNKIMRPFFRFFLKDNDDKNDNELFYWSSLQNYTSYIPIDFAKQFRRSALATCTAHTIHKSHKSKKGKSNKSIHCGMMACYPLSLFSASFAHARSI